MVWPHFFFFFFFYLFFDDQVQMHMSKTFVKTESTDISHPVGWLELSVAKLHLSRDPTCQ